MILNAAKGRDLPVYGDGTNIRDWIHVDDHCKALVAVLHKGHLGESYNIGGQCEKQNIEVVHFICSYLDERLGLVSIRPRRDFMRFVTDRPGHDRRYALDTAKINEELGWRPRVAFEDGLSRTIDWYLENTQWVESILNGTYMDYYRKQYGERLGEEEDLAITYKRMGDFMKQRCPGYTGFIFTGNVSLGKKVGLRAARKIEFYNGTIDCRLLKFELYRGTREKVDSK
jgi:hypothetical protein